MKISSVFHVIGLLLVFVGLFMIFPAIFSLIYDEGDLYPLLISMAITIAFGLIIFKVTSIKGDIQIREGFAIVTLGWLFTAIFGALPFVLSGVTSSYTDAFFETMSGFTTTGATILKDIEVVPHGILFWRSLTHWLGGMGIIVLGVAILPILGVGGMQLFKAEVPGPTPDKIRPRVAQTAKILWGVYLLFTVIETVLLMFGGMDLFDALCHTFGTMATGGFSTKNLSIGHYDSMYIHYVIIIFMAIAGINFTLHYRVLSGKPGAYWKDAEFRFYIYIVLVCTVIVMACNVGTYKSLEELLRVSLFQVVAITTTTGYGTADFGLWIPLAQMLLFCLMFVGGCAGSTGGSMKVMRVMLLLKHGLIELRKLIHPQGVFVLKVGRTSVREEVMLNVLGFFMFYVFFFVIASLIMAGLGLDIISAIGSVAATIGNIGPGLGSVGPSFNYAHISMAGKWLLSFCMLLGRLEIFTVIVLFHPELWRR